MGAARLVEHGVTGLLCPAGDAEALAEALRRISGDAPLKERLAEAASQKVGRFEYAEVGKLRARLLLEAAQSSYSP